MILIKPAEFNRVCKSARLMQVGKYDTWTTEKKEEGIELLHGNILTFTFKDGERDHNGVIHDHRIASVLGVFEKEIKGETKETEPEKKEEVKPQGSAKVEEAAVINGIFPNVLTSTLMSKWALMTTTDRILMFQTTPKDQIYVVVVSKNPDTGKQDTASYVKGNFMFKEANAAFLFDWYLSEMVISVCPTGVSVSSKLNGWFSEYGKYLSRPAVGYQELNKKVDIEQAKKGATTDAIKKGLSLFGFNSDVYSGEV